MQPGSLRLRGIVLAVVVVEGAVVHSDGAATVSNYYHPVQAAFAVIVQTRGIMQELTGVEVILGSSLAVLDYGGKGIVRFGITVGVIAVESAAIELCYTAGCAQPDNSRHLGITAQTVIILLEK